LPAELLDHPLVNTKLTPTSEGGPEQALLQGGANATHLSDPAVRRLSAAEFSIETEPLWPVECDGDLVGNTAVRGRVVPAAISLKI